MKVRGRSLAAGHPGTLVVALLVAAASLTAGQFELPLGRDRSSELFGAHPAVTGEVLVAFRPQPDFARLRADLDADADAIVGDGRVWRVRSRSKKSAPFSTCSPRVATSSTPNRTTSFKQPANQTTRDSRSCGDCATSAR
jgi:hypothetical protein